MNEFVWNDQPVRSLGDIVSALDTIVTRGDADTAAEFLNLYREQSEHADSNVGYALGYLSFEKLAAGLQLFGVSHPVLGSAEMVRGMNPEQAFDLGRAWGEALRRSV